MDEDIKRQEDELAALKATQITAGSQIPVYSSSSGTLSGSINWNTSRVFQRDITFRTTAGYHFMEFSLSSFVQTSNVGYTYIGRFCVRQLPQDGSGVIRLKLRIEATSQQTYPEPPSYTANFTYSIAAFGDATGTFSVS